MTILAHHPVLDDRTGFVQQVVPDKPNGTTLLLLHTAGQSGVQWRHVLRPLAHEGYQCIVPDLPGHGHSEMASLGPVTDVRYYATWLLGVMDYLGVAKPVVIGCSIGGKIALELATHHGSRLTAVVSMCAEAGPGAGKLETLRRELEDSAAPSRTDRTHIGTRAVIGRAVPRDRAALIARMHCREDPLVSNSDLIAWCAHDVRPRLPDIPCPITFVAGEDDCWVDAREVTWAASRAPFGRFILLEGYGHYPMEEIPGFAGLLSGWLRDMGTAS